jgi:hypothetical protein
MVLTVAQPVAVSGIAGGRRRPTKVSGCNNASQEQKMGWTAREKDGQQERHFRRGEPKRAARPEPGRTAHGRARRHP